MSENPSTYPAGKNERLPPVEVIIPHHRDSAMLERCLGALAETRYPAMSVCVVDNASGESGIGSLSGRFDRLRVIIHDTNRGYAGGCNSALFSSSAEYVVFLNDDTLVERTWLLPLVEAVSNDSSVEACQPKILSLSAFRRGERRFDYAGAAGGRIDRLGYPFCLGRTFLAIEQDEGQYDDPKEIFWASGTAMFARRESVAALGGFDEEFFMHMEEIDLCWRLRLAGGRIVSVPDSVAYHEGGATLGAGSFRKRYFNHRNNIAMLLKNMELRSLVWVLPLRFFLELLAAAGFLFRGTDGLRSAGAVLKALGDNLVRAAAIVKKRRTVQAARSVPDRELFRGEPLSILFRRRSPR